MNSLTLPPTFRASQAGGEIEELLLGKCTEDDERIKR
jgi:hypothetical protein